MTRNRIPARGLDKQTLTAKLEAFKQGDGDAKGARLFSLVYPTRDDILEVAKEAYTAFFSENALNPMTFPSLRRMESDVLAMSLSMLNAPDEAVGSMTSGGSESLVMAVKTARDWARAERPHVREPEMLVPVTAHPALLKAAHLLDVKPVIVPMTSDFTADVAAARDLATDSTILVVGSAPQYPHGVLDPIAELADLAASRGILCHVDACIGGFSLPWIEKLGHPLPPWDFRVRGVTSMSADLHKYGYAAKGASVVLYRSRALRRHQNFVYADWPGGLFGSPGVLGTRPGGAIAAAWAVMNYLGEAGYLELTERAMKATTTFVRGIQETPGLVLLGKPATSVIAFGARDGSNVDLNLLCDKMQERGWRMDRQQRPVSLHLTVSPAHDGVADQFVADLRECTAKLATSNEAPSGAAAMYGMLGALPDRGLVRDALLDFMDGIDQVGTT